MCELWKERARERETCSMLMELNLAHPVITQSVLSTEVKTHGSNLKSRFVCRSQDSSVSIVTTYRLDNLLQIPERARMSLQSITIQTGSGGPSSSLFNMYWGSFSGLMWLGHDIDHSVLSSGTIPLLPLCAFMAWIGTTVAFP